MKFKKVFRRIVQLLRTVLLLLISVLLAAGIYVAAAKNIFGQNNPTAFGFSAAVVLTGSMTGTIEPGDIVVTRRQQDYAVGDIISFDSAGSSVTHRIIDIDGDSYVTKGDANNTADPQPTERDSVIGKVVLVIPRVGALIGFIRTPLGILCFLALTAVVIEAPAVAEKLRRRKSD